jgi:hypothetical protein
VKDKDWNLWMVFLIILVALCFLVSMTGCRSARCEPEIKIVEKLVPVWTPPEFQVPDCKELPQYPEWPGDDASEDAKKKWALGVARVNEERNALMQGCIDAHELILKTLLEATDDTG